MPDTYSVRSANVGFGSSDLRSELVGQKVVSERPSTVVIEKELPLDFNNPRNCVLQWLQAWPHFCMRFGLPIMVDFGRLNHHPTIMNRPTGFDWVIYEPCGISFEGTMISLCRKQFATKLDYRLQGYSSRRRGVLSDAKKVDPPVSKTRLWLCRASNTPDRQFLGAKWSDLVERREVFMSPLQRAMLEAMHYFIYKAHLDTKGGHSWTTRMLHAPVFKESARISETYVNRGLNATACLADSQLCFEADHFLNVGDDQGGPREVLEVNLAGYVL